MLFNFNSPCTRFYMVVTGSVIVHYPQLPVRDAGNPNSDKVHACSVHAGVLHACRGSQACYPALQVLGGILPVLHKWNAPEVYMISVLSSSYQKHVHMNDSACIAQAQGIHRANRNCEKGEPWRAKLIAVDACEPLSSRLRRSSPNQK